MQPINHMEPLLLGQSEPVPLARPVLPRRHPASPSRHAVQDRPVQVCVDDLFVGHGAVPLVFNTPNLSRRERPGYVEKSEIVQ